MHRGIIYVGLLATVCGNYLITVLAYNIGLRPTYLPFHRKSQDDILLVLAGWVSKEIDEVSCFVSFIITIGIIDGISAQMCPMNL